MANSRTSSSSFKSSTYNGVSVNTSTNDESSSTSTTVGMTTQTSSVDDSDGLAAAVGGSAVAIGEDTLSSGSISGTLIDSGAVTSADLSATMVAASESPDDKTAIAWTDTYAGVSDGAEVLFTYTVNTETSTQTATGSTATSISTTNLVAYDIHPDTALKTTSYATEDDYAAESGTSGTDDQPESPSPSTDVGGNSSLDGNIAYLEFEGMAAGENTFASVDAFTIAIEGTLSISEGLLLLAVD